MKKILSLPVFCLVLFVLSSAAQQNPAQNPQADNSQYWEMAQKISKGDLNIDYSNLRKAFAEWVNSSAKTEPPNRDEMVKAFEAKDYAKAVELGEKVVPYELISAGVMGAMADAYSQLGNKEKAKFYTDLSHKVRHSLFLSGDGKTAKTAYYVLSIPEEYRVMRELGYTVSLQSLVNVDGQAYDVLTGKDSKGNKAEVYFNICLFFGCGGKK